MKFNHMIFFKKIYGVHLWRAGFAALLLMDFGAWAAEPGVRPQKIVIGMSAPLTGSNAGYGKGLLLGLQTGFARFNDAGGVDGRKLELQVLDDGGRAEMALANTRTFISGGIFAVTGYHGARSIETVSPLLDEGRIPMVGAASSAESLREPMHRGLFNLRAGAREEAAAMVYQLDTVGILRIAAIGHEDGLGRSGMDAIQAELIRLAINAVAIAKVSSQATLNELSQAAKKICDARPAAVLLALDARAALDALRQVRAAGCRPQFYVMSETGADLSSQSVQPGELTGVVVSQVLPSPENMAHPLVAEFKRELAKKPETKASYPALEGYLYARVLGEALRWCSRNLTRDCLVDALESHRIDIPGYRLQFGPNNRRGAQFVELTFMDGNGRLRR
ncbi:ABC transporter substrate-binding protein [soil metagenome]